MSLPGRIHHGILNTHIEEAKHFWAYLVDKLHNSSEKIYQWLFLLAFAVFKNDDMADKMQFILNAREEGIQGSVILARLKNGYNNIEESILPDFFIQKLGIL